MAVTPVFLFSLPRSGSTMLQRALGRHPNIATLSEPWFLLGLIPPTAIDEAVATYEYSTYRMAIEDLTAALPNGEDDWNDAMRSAAQVIYDRLCPNDQAIYFLDKTPRYALAPKAVTAFFPHAPVIILWRNPLAIAASMMTTWSKGRWNLFRFKQDLDIALPRLIDFARANDSALTIRYEEASANLDAVTAAVCDRLGISSTILSKNTDVMLSGRMGDPTGGMKQVSADDRWKAMYCNPLRRWWARRYMDRIGRDSLAVMGYDIDTLKSELKTCNGLFGHLGTDLLLMPWGMLRAVFVLPLIGRQLRRLFAGQPVTEID
jgi:hypothetical protein